jgi:hypothetical protein
MSDYYDNALHLPAPRYGSGGGGEGYIDLLPSTASTPLEQNYTFSPANGGQTPSVTTPEHDIWYPPFSLYHKNP